MSLRNRIPGMAEGHPVWNLFIALFYFGFPYLAFPIAFGYSLMNGWGADRLSGLPGISKEGGYLTFFAGATYGFIGFFLIFSALVLGGGDDTSPAANDISEPTISPTESNSDIPDTEQRTEQPTVPSATEASDATQTPTQTVVSTSTTTRSPTASPTSTPTATPTPTPTPTPEPQPDPGEVVIRTVHEDARGDEYDNLDDEYVVLGNIGGEPVDIGGWTISDEAGHTYTIPDGVTIEPDSTIRIITGSGSDTDTEIYWGSGAPVWNNGGDTATLMDEDGAEVDRYQYD